MPPGSAASWAARMADHIAAATRGSRHPVLVDGARLLAERAALTGGTRRGSTSVGGSCRLLPTLDGWAAVSVARTDDPLLWSALIGQELDDRFPERLEAWLASHTGGELDERVELIGLAGGSVRTEAPRGAQLAPLGRPRSVEGSLVVDFSALWAGPLCANLLGLAGAEVVKVETPARPDGARHGNPAFYDLLHGGHRSVVLDPDDAAGRAALQALVRRADFVIESSRPRALARFGLDAAAEVARGCVWASITAAGRSSQRVGFGDDVAAVTGLVAQDATGIPVFCGDAIADPLTGLAAAALVFSEPTDGGGVLWDVAMADVVAATLVDGIDGADLDGVPIELPTARTPTCEASPSGSDTAAVLNRLGISVP